MVYDGIVTRRILWEEASRNSGALLRRSHRVTRRVRQVDEIICHEHVHRHEAGPESLVGGHVDGIIGNSRIRCKYRTCSKVCMENPGFHDDGKAFVSPTPGTV